MPNRLLLDIIVESMRLKLNFVVSKSVDMSVMDGRMMRMMMMMMMKMVPNSSPKGCCFRCSWRSKVVVPISIGLPVLSRQSISSMIVVGLSKEGFSF